MKIHVIYYDMVQGTVCLSSYFCISSGIGTHLATLHQCPPMVESVGIPENELCRFIWVKPKHTVIVLMSSMGMHNSWASLGPAIELEGNKLMSNFSVLPSVSKCISQECYDWFTLMTFVTCFSDAYSMRMSHSCLFSGRWHTVYAQNCSWMDKVQRGITFVDVMICHRTCWACV